MKHFALKAIILILFIMVNITLCFKILYYPSPISINDIGINKLVSFLEKNNIAINPSDIDIKKRKVRTATVKNYISDQDTFAKTFLGDSATPVKNGYIYMLNDNQVIFDKNSFSFVPKKPVDKEITANIDETNASKKGLKVAEKYGFESTDTIVVATNENENFQVLITNTLNQLPIFNDTIVLDLSENGVSKINGVWFIENSIGEYIDVKSSLDVLFEFVSSDIKPKDNIEIVDITLGYNMVETDKSPVDLKAVWQISLSDGTKYYIDA